MASAIEFEYEVHTVYETVLAVPFIAHVCTGTFRGATANRRKVHGSPASRQALWVRPRSNGIEQERCASESCAVAGIDRSKAHKAEPLIRRLEGIHHFQLATIFQFATPWSVDRQPAAKPRCSALFCLGDGVSLEP